MKGCAGYIRPRPDDVRKALLLVEQVDDDVLSVLEDLFRLSSQSYDVLLGAKKGLNVGSIFNVPLTTAQKSSDKMVLMFPALDTENYDLGLGLGYILSSLSSPLSDKASP